MIYLSNMGLNIYVIYKILYLIIINKKYNVHALIYLSILFYYFLKKNI